MGRFFLLSLLFLLSCCAWQLEAQESTAKKTNKRQPECKYKPNPYVSKEVWDMVKPYFLPSNHSLKPHLDRIFSQGPILTNHDTVLGAGFLRCYPRPTSHIVVLRHPSIKKHLLKVYLEDRPDIIDYEKWITRIEGARTIQAYLDDNDYNNMFKVPKKWIYPLPELSSPPASLTKYFILVVEDMDLHHKQKSYDAWKGSRLTKNRAKAIVRIIQDNGLNDTVYPFNLPFCTDGKQAFVDTEHHHKWPIPYEITMPYLSPKIAEYWKELFISGGSSKKKKK